MLEEDAKKKACPFRLDTDERMGSFAMQFKYRVEKEKRPGETFERCHTIMTDELQETNRCIGSKCMAWGDSGSSGFGFCQLICK